MATFRKRGDKWEYRISFKDPFTQKYRVKSKSGFKTKKEAHAAASEEETKIANGFELDSTSLCLDQYLINWLNEYKKESVRKNTYKLHSQNIKNHILPYFKHILLKDIKPIMYQKFLNHLTAKGYSKRTVEIIHSTMHNAMDKAIILSKIEKNPCTGATISNKNAKKSGTLKYMRSEDIPTFLQVAYMDNYIYYIFFKTLIETGMRKGEAAALQWNDLDLQEGIITINKSLDFQAESEDLLFGDTKTYSSTRQIVIASSLIDDLLKHKQMQDDDKRILGDAYKHDLNLVFCRRDGSFLPKSTLFNAFSRILKKANLSKLSIHSLRHTHAVLMLESGASMKYIQERLGHGSISITSDVYSHISKKINQDSIASFEEYISRILNT